MVSAGKVAQPVLSVITGTVVVGPLSVAVMPGRPVTPVAPVAPVLAGVVAPTTTTPPTGNVTRLCTITAGLPFMSGHVTDEVIDIWSVVLPDCPATQTETPLFVYVLVEVIVYGVPSRVAWLTACPRLPTSWLIGRPRRRAWSCWASAGGLRPLALLGAQRPDLAEAREHPRRDQRHKECGDQDLDHRVPGFAGGARTPARSDARRAAGAVRS